MSLYLKLINVQSELKANKSQFNSFGNYKYRTCEDILEALKPLLLKEKSVINLTDEIVLIGERYYVKAIAKFIDAENGDFEYSVAYAREEECKPKMDTSQTTGSASSYARKYALNGLFAIDDTKDSDTTNTHGKEGSSKPKQEVVNNNTQSSSKKLSEAQIKRLYSIAYKKGVSSEKVKEAVLRKFNKDVSDLTKVEYGKVCNGYEGM